MKTKNIQTILNVRTILKRRLWKTHEVANLDYCNKQSRPMKSAAKVKILSHPGKQTQLFVKLLKILDFIGPRTDHSLHMSVTH